MKVMFVDDEVQVLRGLQRSLEDLFDHEIWQMRFVNSGEQALDEIAKDPVDVLVSDMRMPGMDGASLLEQVSQDHPETVRIVLSGQANLESVYRAIRPMHQYLSKPCNAVDLKNIIVDSCRLRDGLKTKHLNQMVGAIKTIPSSPIWYDRVVAELKSSITSSSKLGELISQDVGMSAKILQVANSAAFGVNQHIDSPRDAVARLGIETIENLVVSTDVVNAFEPTHPHHAALTEIADHCRQVSNLAGKIARHHNADEATVQEACTGGLLHAVGRMIVANSLPDLYSEIQDLATSKGTGLSLAEQRVLASDQAAIGAHFLSVWGLPTPLVDAVADQTKVVDNPTKFSPAMAIAAADWVCSEQATDGSPLPRTDLQNQLITTETAEHLPAWRELHSSLQP